MTCTRWGIRDSRYSPISSKRLLLAFGVVLFLLIGSSAWALSPAQCVAPTSGFVSWWDGDDVSGTAASDIRDGNDGYLQNGATLATGKVGQAFSFDGIDDFVRVPNAPNLNVGNQVTIDSWIKADADNPMSTCCQGLVTTDFYGLTIASGHYLKSTGVIFFANTGSGFAHTSDYATGGYSITPGVWYHVAGVYDGNEIKLYVNGQLEAAAPLSGNIPPMLPTSFLAIGSEDGRTNEPDLIGRRYFHGLIDEVGIFNRALTATEIQAIYDAGSAGKCKIPANNPPLANAGPDQSVHAGTLVTLDGSASADPDGNYPLTYAWVITSMPSGSSAGLSNPTAVNPSFTADKPGDFTVTLTVTDSLGAASALDSVLISTANTPPVADAGPDQSVVVIGSTVQLNGTQSYDLDGDTIVYSWTLTSKPAGSAAVLSNSAFATPTFTADVHGDYTAQLVVSDPWASSTPDSVTVSFSNVKPVANSGGNQSVVAGNTVVLSGSGSTDANGDPLTYSWSLVTAPYGSAAVLSGADTDMASFIADVAGNYVVSLVVNDGFVNSDPSNASITAISRQTAATAALNEAIWVINHLGAEAFKNKNLANALTNKINAVLSMIDNGEYAEAVDKLSSDILTKTDGCAIEGAPDKNDWIITCEAQGQVYPLIIEAASILSSLPW